MAKQANSTCYHWQKMESISISNFVTSQTSPTRPIACESEAIILMAPISCKMSSAAIVSARIRDSANATSSGMSLSR